jgi:hypothetical protein
MKQQPKASSFHAHSVPLLNGNPVMHWPRASFEATTNEFTPGQDEKARGGSIMPPTQAKAPDPDEHALPASVPSSMAEREMAFSALDSMTLAFPSWTCYMWTARVILRIL